MPEAENAIQRRTADHALSIFKAGISALPVVGGPIASLIGDYIPTATERAVEFTANQLKSRIEALESRLDPDAVNKDEFAELFKSCYLVVVRTQQEQKLVAAANLMSNILLTKGDPDKLTYTELDHFVRCLEALSIGAIAVLSEVVRLARGDRRFGQANVCLDFQNVHARRSDLDPDLLMGLLTELNTFHLVHLTGVPGVRTENYGNYPIELPPIGVRFVKHVLGTLDGQAGGPRNTV